MHAFSPMFATSTAPAGFATDVLSCLRQTPKRLSSKYFYDEAGSRLFQQIMHLPEYYLTRSELDVFRRHGAALAHGLGRQGPFDLIELGAGDGLKTKVLLEHLHRAGTQFSYLPVDISVEMLDALAADLALSLPAVPVQPLPGEYFTALQAQPWRRRRVVLFLGSNIGNFSENETLHFLLRLRGHLHPGDALLLGFDLQKNPATILAAYNDAQGVTRAFNLNLLHRLNRELDADFDVAQFDHYALYDPTAGEARSYLVSLARQRVRLGAVDETLDFAEGETIHTETSRKYTVPQMQALCRQAGLRPVQVYTDARNYFADLLLQA